MTPLFPKPFRPTITKYERRLQTRLRKEGIPFKAQAKIHTKSGRTYLVDILIPPSLVIEVGYINKADIQEHEDLKQTDYTVLHFKNREINEKLIM